MRVASKVGNHPSKFRHARPLGSRIIRNVRDGRTDRQADGQKQRLLPPPLYDRGIINITTTYFHCFILAAGVTESVLNGHHLMEANNLCNFQQQQRNIRNPVYCELNQHKCELISVKRRLLYSAERDHTIVKCSFNEV